MIPKLVNTPRYIFNAEEIKNPQKLPEILLITSYPPRECGIATYSQDLTKALNNKFGQSFKLTICPLESEYERHSYPQEVEHVLNTNHPIEFIKLIYKINANDNIKLVVIQHEFGFFEKNNGNFIQFLKALEKPILIVFHTVLPHPDQALKSKVQRIVEASKSIVVMTNNSAKILVNDYNIELDKITVIPHGTHLVSYADKAILKQKYNLTGKRILSTFGLLGSGKSIETTLNALPKVIEQNPDVLFLIIGKTHPTIVINEGEVYRNMLEQKVVDLHLESHVKFINYFLPLPDLLEYLQLTDIYLFTSKDPNQAVSGTFSYAISSGCPIISTPIPHAKEVLQDDAGIIIDFEDSLQLTDAINNLLANEQLRINISSNGLHKMASTAWENSAIAHAMLFEKVMNDPILLHYTIPAINLDHINKLTTDFGMIQFSKINQPDIDSGYTLDDNARAMIAMCQHFEHTGSQEDIRNIEIYLKFIGFCQQNDGKFLNYVNEEKDFTDQNSLTNLDDSNGRAIWALGYLVNMGNLLPSELTITAKLIIKKALETIDSIHSPRAMGFVIKGLYYQNIANKSEENTVIIECFANRLVQMYRHESTTDWDWFESYLTYGNCILPEAMLCAYLSTNKPIYKQIAKSSFDFLLSKTFSGNEITIISNKNWLSKGAESTPNAQGGEQAIDVAYSIMALSKFYDVFADESYKNKMGIALNWFLGANHLHQIIYNPCTGGCYDGLEEINVNLNQGAESSVSYLMARLTIEKNLITPHIPKYPKEIYHLRLNKKVGVQYA